MIDIELLLEASLQTIVMVLVSTLVAAIIGIPIGIILILSQKGGLKENSTIYSVLNGIINLLRSIPFIILMILLFPLSRLIVGTSIGTKAAIIPLAISASPAVARAIEQNLNNVDSGKVEASLSMGSNHFQVVKMLLREALPAIVATITTTTVNIIGYSAMAGTIGGGGLGDVAIRYGLHRGDTAMLIGAVIILVVFVQLINLLGSLLSKRVDKTI